MSYKNVADIEEEIEAVNTKILSVEDPGKKGKAQVDSLERELVLLEELKKSAVQRTKDSGDKDLENIVAMVSDRFGKKFKAEQNERLDDIEKKVGNKKEFKKQGCEAQYYHDNKLLRVIDSVIKHINDEDQPDVKFVLENLSIVKDAIEERVKHVLIAEDYGWDTVDLYKRKEYANDDADFKRIQKCAKVAQSTNGKGGRGEGSDTKGPRKGSTDTSSVLCFNCNQYGHYANQCPLKKGRRGEGQYNQPPPFDPFYHPNMMPPHHPSLWNMHPPNASGPYPPPPQSNFGKR
jgi:hypothetical protein